MSKKINNIGNYGDIGFFETNPLDEVHGLFRNAISRDIKEAKEEIKEQPEQDHTDILNKIESAKTEIMTAPEQQHKDILDAISASTESVIDSHTKKIDSAVTDIKADAENNRNVLKTETDKLSSQLSQHDTDMASRINRAVEAINVHTDTAESAVTENIVQASATIVSNSNSNKDAINDFIDNAKNDVNSSIENARNNINAFTLGESGMIKNAINDVQSDVVDVKNTTTSNKSLIEKIWEKVKTLV